MYACYVYLLISSDLCSEITDIITQVSCTRTAWILSWCIQSFSHLCVNKNNDGEGDKVLCIVSTIRADHHIIMLELPPHLPGSDDNHKSFLSD